MRLTDRFWLKYKGNRLLLKDGSLLIQDVRYQLKGYLSVKETAEKWGISVRWVNQYIQAGRIPGCEKLGSIWAIPVDAVKPEKLPTGPKPKKRAASSSFQAKESMDSLSK